MPCASPAGPTLLLLAGAVSIQLAQGRSEEEVALMSAFFNVLGENLELLASAPAPERCPVPCGPRS